MNLELISADQALLALCRDIARESSAIAWTLTRRDEFSGDQAVDLCLFDYLSNLPVPRDLRWGTHSFILVSPADLFEFRASFPYAEPGIVLKPVTRAVLEAIIMQRIPRFSRDANPADQHLRADRDELLQCLMQANLQLQEYDAYRNNFLGRAMHDFHAPLSALTGYCGLLMEEKTGLLSDQQRLIVQRMQRSLRRLSRMSKAMFHLSVGRHVPVTPILRKHDIRECLEQALYEVQQLLDEKQIRCSVDMEPPPEQLLSDSGQIEQVFLNLLENACKLSPRGGSLLVKGYSCFWDRRAENVHCTQTVERRWASAKLANAYRIDLQDSGPGVNPEHIDSIFDEYVSYAGRQHRSSGGLGLAICRMIVSQHKGRIWVENSGGGATFSILLPLQDAGSTHETIERSGFEVNVSPTCA